MASATSVPAGFALLGQGVVVAILAACSPGPSELSRPNVLLISVDTLRADHLGCYGYERDTSPFLDSLAAQSVVFDSVSAQSSWTLTSHMSLFTSRYPHNHGIEGLGLALSETVPTLAQVLKQEGYTTLGFVTWVFLAERFGFGRGYDLYRQYTPPQGKLGPEHGEYVMRADEVVDRITKTLGDGVDAPFFLFVHLFDPHLDYQPPLEHARRFDPQATGDFTEGRHATLVPYITGVQPEPQRIAPEMLERVVALYDGEVHFTDTQLARLFDVLEAKGMLDDTLVVFTSDHGEELDDHGSMEGHGWTLYEEVLRVPLIVKFPAGQHAGARVEALAESIDIAPTILEVLGIEAPESFDGKSLIPLVEGEVPTRQLSFSSSQRFISRWSVRTEKHKLIRSKTKSAHLPYHPPEYELFDLSVDPTEQMDLYSSDPDTARKLRLFLDAWIETRRKDVSSRKIQLDDRQQERLRALGYASDE